MTMMDDMVLIVYNPLKCRWGGSLVDWCGSDIFLHADNELCMQPRDGHLHSTGSLLAWFVTDSVKPDMQ